jgi:CRP/FNR family transcriptional regulator, cyclic AMP receptor protein
LTPEPRDPATVIARTFNCAPDLASLIAAKAHYRDHAPRTIILEGAGGEGLLFLMITGRAQALVYALDGRLMLVDDYSSGDIFGEAGLWDDTASGADVTAVDAVRSGQFRSPDFISLMENYSSIALAMSRMLIERLGKTTRRLVEGATLSATGRIHAELLRQARAGQKMTIAPAPVLSVFALTVQSTRETVSRTINALQKRGIIHRDDHSLTVVAPHRLEELIF